MEAAVPLQRRLGLALLVLYGTGITVGAGIYVLIGAVLEAYVVSHEVDLLVMGAYGHSRLREFVLGGATRSLLSKPPLPVLFSH